MSEEAKIQKVNFSLPYRAGMENEPGFVSKVETTSKTYGDAEKVFAKFAFALDETIAIKDEEALEVGRKVLRQNKQRANLIGSYAKKYQISAPGVPGGLTKTDRGLIGAMGELTKDYAKIAQAFTKKTGKAITVDEVKEILAV